MIYWQTTVEIMLFGLGIIFLYRTLIALGTWKIVYGILLVTLFLLYPANWG